MRTFALLSTIVAAASFVLVAPNDAHACGGLFCDGAGPQAVNQSAERIIFTDNGDGTITTVVQIMYEGPTDQFGWLLPVPGIPEVGISSDSVFQTLQNASNPLYTLNRSTEGECASGGGGPVFGASADSTAERGGNSSFNDGQEPGVQVVAGGNTGPYDWVVLQVDETNPDNTQLALDWLQDNNYQVTNAGPELIEPYLRAGMNLLAVRLQKNQEEGAVRPMTLTYDSDYPMIPIKLTAVAANSDMGVLVWVLGDSRAVPRNYKALEINDAIINWFNPAPTYNDVINVAADEAGGQGFVTEHATDTSFADQMFFRDDDADAWEQFQRFASEGQLADELLDRAWLLYRGWEGFDDAINALNADIDTEQFRTTGAGALPLNINETVEPATVVTVFEDFVVAPMRDTQELFDNTAYMTRLYTTLSPAEMTVDPEFHFNDALGDVPFQHTADHITECNNSVTFSEAPWRAELPSGLVVRGNQRNVWPFTPGEEMPANLAIREIGQSGEGEIVTDNVRTIRLQLDEHNATVDPPRSGGCSSTSASNGLASIIAFLGLFFGVRRRRSQER